MGHQPPKTNLQKQMPWSNRSGQRDPLWGHLQLINIQNLSGITAPNKNRSSEKHINTWRKLGRACPLPPLEKPWATPLKRTRIGDLGPRSFHLRRLIASFLATRFAIKLRLISINIRLIVTLGNGPYSMIFQGPLNHDAHFASILCTVFYTSIIQYYTLLLTVKNALIMGWFDGENDTRTA